MVLLKKDKNLLTTDSYRLISLLNGNGKILTKVLSQRFQIIHNDQVGFMSVKSTSIYIAEFFSIYTLPLITWATVPYWL